jgi:hypothetical protein
LVGAILLSPWFIASPVLAIAHHQFKSQLQGNTYKIKSVPEEIFQTIEMENFATVSAAGKPMLPYMVKEFILPENASISSVKLQVMELNTKPLTGNFLIKPAPRSWHDPHHGMEEGSRLVFDPENSVHKDGVVYGRNAFFPETPIKLSSISTKGGPGGQKMNIARVVFSPFQYNPVTKQLLLTETAAFTLEYETYTPPIFAAAAAMYNYVIITTEAIAKNSKELTNFINHKKKRNFSVKVVTESDFDSLVGPPPNGRAERIRLWLINNWQKIGIEYVLLIGNPEPADPMYSEDLAGDIPMKQIWHDLAGGNFQWGDATDWYYADLTGNWDMNGDGFYGVSPWLLPIDVQKSPLPTLVDPAGFSVSWNGNISIPEAGVTSFQLKQWQGARLYIDHVLFMENWPQAKKKTDTLKEINLSQGDHAISLFYFQSTGHGHCLLQWKPPNQDWRDMSGLTGYYYRDINLQQPVATRYGETIRKNWENTDFAKTGGVDLDAEVSVGRIPVYNNDYASLDTILRNIIKYESGGFPGNRSKKILLAMKPMDASDSTASYTLGEAIYHDLALPRGFQAYRIYDATYGLNPPPNATPCSPANVINAWNLGFGMVTWAAHGTWRWADQILDVKYHLSQLLDTFPPIVFQASCSNGHVYLPDCYPGCSPDMNGDGDGRISLAYSLLKQGKAIATVAATEVSSYRNAPFSVDEYDLTNERFAYRYTREILKNHASAGGALKNIKYTHFFVPGVDDYTNYHNQLIYNLFGDPSLKLRRPNILPFNLLLLD